MKKILGDQIIGSEIIDSKMKMGLKSLSNFFFSFFVVAVTILFVSCFFIYPKIGPSDQKKIYNAAWWADMELRMMFWEDITINVFPDYSGGEIKTTRQKYADAVLRPQGDDLVQDYRRNLTLWLKLTFVFSFAGGIFGMWIWKKISTRSTEKHLEDIYIRGAKLISESEYRKVLVGKRGDIPIAFVEGKENKPLMWMRDAETEHLLILKRPGQGGTVMMMHALEKIIERGDRCLIFDFKGDYTQKFFREGQDVILNPFDERSVDYSFFQADVNGTTDINMISHVVVSHSYNDSQPYFNNASRDILTGLLEILYKKGKKENADIYNHTSKNLDELADFLRSSGHPDAAAHLEKSEGGSGNVAALNVKSNLQSKISFLKQSRAIDIKGGSFSLRNWAKEGQGNVFLAADPARIDSLKILYQIYLDLLFNFLLSLPDDLNRRLFIFLDEFGNLSRLSKISEVLSAGRSKGISVIMSLQSVDQLKEKFGDKGADVVSSLFGSFALFNTEGHTKEFCSRLIGKTIISEVEHGMQFGPADQRDGFNFQRREKEKDLVKDSEISQLDKFCYYLKVSGVKEWTLTRTLDPKIKFFPIKNEAFVPKPDPLHVHSEKLVEKEKITKKGIEDEIEF